MWAQSNSIFWAVLRLLSTLIDSLKDIQIKKIYSQDKILIDEKRTRIIGTRNIFYDFLDIEKEMDKVKLMFNFNIFKKLSKIFLCVLEVMKYFKCRLRDHIIRNFLTGIEKTNLARIFPPR